MVRFILDKNPRAHIGLRELDRLGLLNVQDRVTQLKLNHVFKVEHSLAPKYMCDNFTRVSDRYSYNTRQSLFNFAVPTHSGRNTFSVTAIKDWNALPSNIKSISSLSVFKKQVKLHLSQKANQ